MDMLPRIKNVKLGNINVNDSDMTGNFFLHAKGVEHIDGKLSKKECQKMLLRDPEVLVLSTGFMGRAKIPEDVIELAGKSAELHLLRTQDAIERFKEFARKGKNVVAYIHVGE